MAMYKATIVAYFKIPSIYNSDEIDAIIDGIAEEMDHHMFSHVEVIGCGVRDVENV